MHTAYSLCTCQHWNQDIKPLSWELTLSRNLTLGMSVNSGMNCAWDWWAFNPAPFFLVAYTQIWNSCLNITGQCYVAVTSVPSIHQVDKDSLVRKQAFYVLTISLSIFTSSSGNDSSQHSSSRSSTALPAQIKANAGATKRERWANKEAKSLGVGEMDQSGGHCSNGQDRWKVFLLLYEMLQEYGTHLVEAAWTHQVN